MATNLIYKYTESKTRVRVLPAITLDGKPVFDPADARPAVTLTGTGTQADRTLNTTNTPLGGGVKSITYNVPGGASLVGLEATLAYDGTWEFDGVVSSGSTAAPTSTANGTKVYLKSNGGLSLASGDGTIYGTVDYPTDYFKRAGILPVRIGA